VSVPRVIFHVDMDAFYVSVERREKPELLGKPVCVGALPEGGKARGVVMAASYEARALGVRSGMPISLAYRKAPDAVYLEPNFELYGDVSESVMNVLREFADVLEHASIDEAFLDVTKRTGGDYGKAVELAKEVKAAVRTREGLTCSIGVAPNKSAAKIASDLSKPDGLTVVPPDKVAEFLAPLPVGKISGVGQKTEEALTALDIKTIGDLAKVPGKELTARFGRNAVWLWGIARGIEEVPVEERPDPKSISVERTFDRDVEEWPVILETMDDVAHNVWLRAKGQGVRFRTVGIKIRFEGFVTHTRERTIGAHVADEAIVKATCRELLAEFEGRKRPVRLLGARVSHLQKAVAAQRPITEFGG
jgi:DNA polymerase IV (DinB-like DNA polymerase)